MTLIRGLAVVWNDEALVDGHRECFARGAFRYALSTSLRVAHDQRPGAALAWAMPVAETSEGLEFAALLDDDDPDHRRAVAAIRGGLTGVSLGFKATRSHWEGDLEVITQSRLREISVCVGSPSYGLSCCWLDDGSPAPRSRTWTGVDRATGAKPPRQPIDRQPAALARACTSRVNRPAAVVGPVRAAVEAYMGAYLARAPI